MNKYNGFKIAALGAVLALAGCLGADPETPQAPDPLTKSSATNAEGGYCPKFEKFISGYVGNLQSCMQASDIETCFETRLTSLFDPVVECLDMKKPVVTSVQDLVDLGEDIGNAVRKFETDPAAAQAFAECLCGTSFGGSGSASLDVSVTSGANSTISGGSSSGSNSRTGATTSSGANSRISGNSSSGSSSKFGN